MESSLNYWVQVMINEDMVHILDIVMAKSLSLVSRSISNTVKRFIEDNFYFSMSRYRWDGEVNIRRCTFYQPKNIGHVFSILQINADTRGVKFGSHFNKDIDLSTFTNLTHIEFNYYFNKSIENRLPPSITHLTLGHDYNLPIQSLPPSIKQVRFNGSYFYPTFNQPISHLNSKIEFQTIHFSASQGNFVVEPYQYKP
eukprot:TRINITY_DN6557_c0_g1_i1.p1 TRINITY_DN6557_c0_g1~~TRINITY_DN6557_c0_g1_i1.p1  ORF type:complete len:198 (-),score=35.00 TRINITY_DN6557_c0_g1_i1:47-640(-)